MQITKKIEVKISFNFDKSPLISKFLYKLYESSDKKLCYDSYSMLTIDELTNHFIDTINYKKQVINIDELNIFFENFNQSLELFLKTGYIMVDQKRRFVVGIKYFIQLPTKKRELSIEFTNINEFKKCIKGTCELNNEKISNKVNELSLLITNKFKFKEYEIYFNNTTLDFDIKNFNPISQKILPDNFNEPTIKNTTIKPHHVNYKIGTVKEFSISSEKELADYDLIEKYINDGWVMISKKHKENRIIFTFKKEH